MQRHLPPSGPNDQQALAELHAIFDVMEMQRNDVVPCLLQEAQEVMARHRNKNLTMIKHR